MFTGFGLGLIAISILYCPIACIWDSHNYETVLYLIQQGFVRSLRMFSMGELPGIWNEYLAVWLFLSNWRITSQTIVSSQYIIIAQHYPYTIIWALIPSVQCTLGYPLCNYCWSCSMIYCHGYQGPMRRLCYADRPIQANDRLWIEHCTLFIMSLSTALYS